MRISEMFEIGQIFESDEKSPNIKALSSDDAVIVGKMLNRKKIILHMKRESDASEGNVFVRLKDEYQDQFALSKKLLATKHILGLSLNQLRNLQIDAL
ncbi:MAG TPA: hypothetical protein VEA59_02525 [Patescibacteria group bacterium]|nr:hypothetical protein [Patescibacteria group bacterium]